MMKKLLIFINLFLFVHTLGFAQNRYKLQVVKKETVEEYTNGVYHKRIYKDRLTSIEVEMQKASFCQISGSYLLSPACVSLGREISTDDLRNLLNKNVIQYFRLEAKCKTPLQEKRFKEGSEYKAYAEKLERERGCVLNQSYFFKTDIDSQYSLDSHNFSIDLYDFFYNFKFSTTDEHFGNRYFTTSEIDENIAYEIETHPTELVVFLKFEEDIYNDKIFCKPLKVYISNKRTGHIYYKYTPSETACVNINVESQSRLRSELDNDSRVSEIAEQMPSFRGNVNQWLCQNLIYPKVAVENGVQGRVIVNFIVEKDGSISKVQVVRSVDPALDSAAVDVVRRMPKWNPGMRDGKPARVRFTLPITFKL